MCSPEPAPGLTPPQRQTLLATARTSIDTGLRDGRPAEVDPEAYEAALQTPRASFVTLRDPRGDLRGCMGSAAAARPLVVDVARNAYNAAFLDPRFEPLSADELPGLHLHISVLSAMEPLPAASEAELLDRVRPGIDGLVVEEGNRRATLLPSVWDSLPHPERFLYELRRKAGLPGHHWSDTIRFQRYTAESFDR